MENISFLYAGNYTPIIVRKVLSTIRPFAKYFPSCPLMFDNIGGCHFDTHQRVGFVIVGQPKGKRGLLSCVPSGLKSRDIICPSCIAGIPIKVKNITLAKMTPTRLFILVNTFFYEHDICKVNTDTLQAILEAATKLKIPPIEPGVMGFLKYLRPDPRRKRVNPDKVKSNLRSMTSVKFIKADSSGLTVRFNSIDCFDDRTGVVHQTLPTSLTITPAGSFIFHDWERYSLKMCNRPHPHVFDTGGVCFGSAGKTIYQLLFSGKLLELIHYLTVFLSSANTDDVCGSKIHSFPVKGETRLMYRKRRDQQDPDNLKPFHYRKGRLIYGSL